jgi:anti-sigma regulatory factor (Ser/Thr protein kinase)
MEVAQSQHVLVGDTSGVGHARRIATDIAQRHGFAETDVGKIALVVTELASNLLKHAGAGELLLQTLVQEGAARGIEIVSLDRGPGFRDVSAALRDGYSTAGTPGTGIGAVARQATDFDVHSRAGEGVIVLARVWDRAPRALPISVGAVNVCHPHEEICGDVWAFDETANGARVMVADGLGHGPTAAHAARAARTVFATYADDSPVDLLERMNAALTATRGAAVAVANVDWTQRIVRFSGVGNIAASIEDDATMRSFVSHHGTIGHDARRLQEFTYTWPEHGILVLHSDGVDTRWRIATNPGLARRDPTVIAAALYRDHRRGRDDATVVVLKERT